ncbi:hypothetical protein ACJRO7_033336 [Eucalyptus globulus]|uniref:F-box domain-containing protein n=1 Tax=Eucalyptus globulus TaxID=34317 RepID=A0ABD3JLS4_EUCGL
MEISRCFPWLSRHRRKQDGFKTLPDDVVMDVLSRLEVDQLGHAKRVCRSWRALIGTAHFTRVHLQRASSVPVISPMFFDRKVGDRGFLFFPNWSSQVKKPIRGAKSPGFRYITTMCICDLLGCCDGLLIFSAILPFSIYEIQNPVTQEEIVWEQDGSICGFFLQSLPNKYRLLSYRETPNGFLYHTGGLWPAAWKNVGMFPYRPREQETPSGVEGRLHWMVVGKEGMSTPCSHSIMVFSTRESKFCFMPHPGDSCPSSDGHSNMHLVEMKGRVYVYAIRDKLMLIWVLEDYASWHWVKKCDIDLERDFNQHPASESVTSYSDYKGMQLIDSQDGELLLFWPHRGFFRYNLRSRTITQVMLGLSRYGMMSRVVVAEFKSSLVSLKDLQ